MKKLLALAIALMLLCAFACAEETNPFLGHWTVLYYISDGAMLTPGLDDVPDTFIFDDAMLSLTQADMLLEQVPYTQDGATATATTMTITITGSGTATAVQGATTVLLQQNNLGGAWNVDCWVRSGSVSFPDDSNLPITFVDNTYALVDRNLFDYGNYHLTFQDGILYDRSDAPVGAITLLEGHVLHVVLSGVEEVYFYREDGASSGNYDRFLGSWSILLALKGGVPTASVEDAVSQLRLDKITFTPSAVKVSKYNNIMEQDVISTRALCTYEPDGCSFIHQDTACSGTIDAAGMLTLTMGDWTLMMMKAQ